MSQYAVPSAPPVDQGGIPTAPPSYDEAVGNLAPPPRDQNISSSAQLDVVNEEERKKDQKKQDQPLNAPPPLVTVQPQPQQQMTYNFDQPVYQQPASPSNDCCLFCLWCDGSEIADLCYCIFCCSRHVTGHDAGCCDCGDTCCDCPEGCCECGDCDCDCGDCDCGDCDCGGGGDCNCGDCSII
ncbi:uncharacterized protein LOC123320744 isoform X2 [Coccinella septempunctata]|uniref:uncharacterized protein LOC123320744 isoform X2 n=1 Tax=Coccinella septempunctata TaxID=41139 RepID=UPI001D07CDA4|nr:uncharacterized protein LOC123320744 isoform X2 [Coccinella septempunctata]